MLTRLKVRNFKQFGDADIELGKSVVFIGPNNSGKTTALQALALWELGLRHWRERHGDNPPPKKRMGVPINRKDLISLPIPASNLLWKNLHVRTGETIDGKTRTKNIRIETTVEGVTADKAWSCSLEFDYSNEEVFICRPLRLPGFEDSKIEATSFSEIPVEALGTKVAYLPPMSGLADREFVKQPGEIGFLIGQGQTAQVLRNLCYQLVTRENASHWNELREKIRSLFGVTLSPPELRSNRSEIVMEYEQGGATLDLSCSGRGLQQTILLLAHLFANPGTVLLLDEPDAHLEILRQRQTYQLISDVAASQNSQIVCASHSEIVLQEAASRGTVVAFVGKPHRIDDRGSQVVKSLSTIGWDQYYQAEITGWVLYLEDASDLAILREFARLIGHTRAQRALMRPFCHYVSTNVPQFAREHFYGLREGKSDLTGLALFDRLEKQLQTQSPLTEIMWRRREIENYFCRPEVLMAYARGKNADDLFSLAEIPRREAAMKRAIDDLSQAFETLGRPSIWSPDVKATDEVLDPLLKNYFRSLKLPIALRKAEYFSLIGYLSPSEVDPEVRDKLDLIVAAAERAHPASD